MEPSRKSGKYRADGERRSAEKLTVKLIALFWSRSEDMQYTQTRLTKPYNRGLVPHHHPPKSAHGVRFRYDYIKTITISSSAVKRRPAPPVPPSSVPQVVLSPKRLRQTPHQIINSPVGQFAVSQGHLVVQPGIQVGQVATPVSQGENHIQLHQANTTTPLPITSATPVTAEVAPTMDNPMGQMAPMAPLALSQSMDSVNTASNEEENPMLRGVENIQTLIPWGRQQVVVDVSYGGVW
ncbi:hypothetical protein DMENIID0001_101450 [Sergentomyia squamirostris]